MSGTGPLLYLSLATGLRQVQSHFFPLKIDYYLEVMYQNSPWR